MQKEAPILERMRLDGRVALVTGGGQGIGEAFALALGEAGAAVAVVDLNQERAAAVAAEVRSRGVEALGIAGDVRRREDIDAFVRAVTERWGRLDIAVNNAGVNATAPAEEMPIEDWDAIFSVNARAVFQCCQAEAAIMLPAGYGKIVNTASMASVVVPHPQRQVAYNASKATVLQLTRTLAAEWADRGVRVNCISPGVIRTALVDDSPELTRLASVWLEQIPLRRLGHVSDLQAAVVYLAGSSSDYMTGHNLAIDGGHSLW